MTEREIILRLDRLENSMQQSRDAIVRLETKVGAGPGETSLDQQMDKRLLKIDDRLTVLERKIWIMAGVVALAVFLSKLLGQGLFSIFHQIPK